MIRPSSASSYPATGQGSGNDLPRTAALVCLLALLALYAAMCLYGSWTGFTGDFDTGTVELMAVNIASGEDFPLFWYGLHYAGALEAYVAAAMIRLFGFSELALTLSPLLFSLLWLAGTYLLFAEILDRRAGLVATLAAVFSGYYAWYYSYALSGGYSVILAFGTLVLWLGVRVCRRNPGYDQLWLHVLAIGILSALALWVHFFILPYLLVTALCLLVHWGRRGFAPSILALYLAGALLAACGLLPILLATGGRVGGSSIATFVPQWQHLRRSLRVLVHGDLSQYVFWKGDIPFDATWLAHGYILISLLVLGAGLMYIGLQRERRQVLLLSVPLLYLIFFLAMFLPHRMAVIPAARYLFGPWAMMVSAMWACCSMLAADMATRHRGVRVLFAILLLFWAGYNGLGDLFFARSMARIKQERLQDADAVLALVREAGLRAVFLLGNERYGYEGQKLSALAGNRIRFVHTGRERYQKNAQAVESDPAYGLMCRAADSGRVVAALAPLRLGYHRQTAGGSTLFQGFRVAGEGERGIDPAGMVLRVVGNARGRPGDLVDGNASTAVVWKGPSSSRFLEIDLGGERLVSGFWLFAPPGSREGTMQRLPVSYRVSAAGADGRFAPVLSFRSRVNQAYVQADHVYVSGYFGRAECRFRPRPLRYLRVTLDGRSEVRLNEIVLFEKAGIRPDAATEADRVMALLRRNRVRFTYADRWLSARIVAALAPVSGRLPALPRFNPRADDQRYCRLVVPGPGLALAPARKVADACARQILTVYGPQAIRRRIDLDGYSLFFLDRAQRKAGQGFLYWNGHLLVRLQEYHDLATINLDGAGLRYLDPGRDGTAGFYHDGWTDGLGIFRDLHIPLEGTERVLVLVTNGNTPHHGDPVALGLQVTVNGRVLRFLRRQGTSYLFQLPQELDTVREVRLKSRTFIPANRDQRTLGMDVVRVLFP